MLSRELLDMIKSFLDMKYNANDFSFDFPDRLHEVYQVFLAENRVLCDYLEEEMPELCSWFDPYETGCEGTMDEPTFRKRVQEIYNKALALNEDVMAKTV